MKNRCFSLDLTDVDQRAHVVISDETELWHKRLGHCNEFVLQDLSKKDEEKRSIPDSRSSSTTSPLDETIDDIPVRGTRSLSDVYQRCNVSLVEPKHFGDAVKDPKWIDAMQEELNMIDKNQTWVLVDRPEHKKVIGVKSVFKTKLNAYGSINKYGEDFIDTFAPVAHLDTIRLILAIAAQKGWAVWQLDVKSAFLNGYLEVEMDDWLFEFAQLFRSHVGIDPDAHIDLHELGMELCSEALEETVTSKEAQDFFDKAASKFQEVATLAFFNWGNVHMCAVRKRIPLDESAGKEVLVEQLQVAYDWVKEKYSLARERYEEALSIKPDFYEGLLALGQQQFEMAKLHWSFALAKKMDLSGWDSTETLQFFDNTEEKMKAATDMWEKLEEQRANELKDPNASKKEELRMKLGMCSY